jgi:hypothetical protein
MPYISAYNIHNVYYNLTYRKLNYVFGMNSFSDMFDFEGTKTPGNHTIRSALFWDITQRRVVIVYRRFGTTYPSHLQGSRSPRRSC